MNNSIYIIGEIGQNHNGSVDIAKLIIDNAARPVIDKQFGERLRGMDAIKLVKRDLKHELSISQMNKKYDSPHSFGKTYGEHREYLELDYEQHYELYKYAKGHNLDLVETLCAPSTLGILNYFVPDRLKIASRDLTNLPLLAAMAETKIPIIVSTGMANRMELDTAINLIAKYHSNISILHCVSEYPTQYKNVNLNTIKFLLKNYSSYIIGYSDHTIGIATPVAAAAIGAKIIEKHITLDWKMKGTDQAGSLAIDGIERMVRDLRNLELCFGVDDIFMCDNVATARIKLERSIAANIDLEKGHIINENDLHLLSPGDGFKWIEKEKVIGKKLIGRVPKDEIIYPNILE